MEYEGFYRTPTETIWSGGQNRTHPISSLLGLMGVCKSGRGGGCRCDFNM